MEARHTCQNCGHHYADAFCSHCGQKTAHRITLKHIGHDLVHAFTHADKGFFFLLKQLFIRPGVVAREYIVEGKRKKYFNPFQYLLIIGSIGVIIAVNTHLFEKSMALDTTATAIEKDNQIAGIASLFSKYYNFILLINIPFLALGSYWVFKKHKFNYAEHLTLNTFFVAQVAIFNYVGMLMIYININLGLAFLFVLIPLILTYFSTAYTRFFHERNFRGVLKALLSYFLGIFMQTIVIMIIGFVSFSIYKVLVSK